MPLPFEPFPLTAPGPDACTAIPSRRRVHTESGTRAAARATLPSHHMRTPRPSPSLSIGPLFLSLLLDARRSLRLALSTVSIAAISQRHRLSARPVLSVGGDCLLAGASSSSSIPSSIHPSRAFCVLPELACLPPSLGPPPLSLRGGERRTLLELRAGPAGTKGREQVEGQVVDAEEGAHRLRGEPKSAREER